MCDYSLECYESRKAVEGETFTTTRFLSGTIGLVDNKNSHVAVCVTPGARLTLQDVPTEILEKAEQSTWESVHVEFIRIEGSLHHDGVKFKNGFKCVLQRLGSGVTVTFDKMESLAEKFEEVNMQPVIRDFELV